MFPAELCSIWILQIKPVLCDMFLCPPFCLLIDRHTQCILKGSSLQINLQIQFNFNKKSNFLSGPGKTYLKIHLEE